MKTKKLTAVRAEVRYFSVFLTMSDGSVIERDFVMVLGTVFRKWRRKNGIDPRVRLDEWSLSWPGDIDFELDNVIWGWPRRRGRPLKRAMIGADASLIPAPLVNELT